MNIFSILIAGAVILLGLRLTGIALQTALTGKVLVRKRWQGHWQSVPHNEALKVAFRDGLLGILLVLLGVMLLT